MLTYYINIWEWDTEIHKYLPHHVTASDDYDSIRIVFDSITVNNNRPQVELWEVKEDHDERLIYKRHMGRRR